MNRPVRHAALLAAALVAACGGGDRAGAGGGAASDTRLPPAPVAIVRACEDVARRADFAVRCPRGWPAHAGPGTAKTRAFTRTAGAYLVDVENGFRRRGGHVFHLLFGGQRRPFGAWPAGTDRRLRLTSRTVTVPMRGGGRFVQQRPARAIATARVGDDRHAIVLREPPYPQGGLHGGHVVVLWNAGGHGYAVSVHGARLTQRELIAIALEIARRSRVA